MGIEAIGRRGAKPPRHRNTTWVSEYVYRVGYVGKTLEDNKVIWGFARHLKRSWGPLSPSQPGELYPSLFKGRFHYTTTLYHGGKELKNATHPLPPFFTFNHELPSANPARYPPNHSSNLPYFRYRSLFPLPAVSQPQSIWLRCCAVRYELLLLQPLCLQGRLWGMKARATKRQIPLYLLQATSRVAWSRCDLVHLNGAPHSRYAFDTLSLYFQISRLGQALQALRSSTLVTRNSLNFCLR